MCQADVIMNFVAEGKNDATIGQTKKQKGPEVKGGLQFLRDSPEQIEESMERLGPLRGQLYEVFQEAIDRAERASKYDNRSAECCWRATESLISCRLFLDHIIPVRRTLSHVVRRTSSVLHLPCSSLSIH